MFLSLPNVNDKINFLLAFQVSQTGLPVGNRSIALKKLEFFSALFLGRRLLAIVILFQQQRQLFLFRTRHRLDGGDFDTE